MQTNTHTHTQIHTHTHTHAGVLCIVVAGDRRDAGVSHVPAMNGEASACRDGSSLGCCSAKPDALECLMLLRVRFFGSTWPDALECVML